jgi:hypothetical protein
MFVSFSFVFHFLMWQMYWNFLAFYFALKHVLHFKKTYVFEQNFPPLELE